jgi:hypothetical protein
MCLGIISYAILYTVIIPMSLSYFYSESLHPFNASLLQKKDLDFN